MRVATGDYIGFCDGDDVPDVDMFEFLMNIALKDNADISICEVRFEFEDGTVRNIATGKSKIWNNNESFLCDLFKGNVGMSTYTKLFKAKVCRGVEYPENCKTNEDKYFCFLAALNSNTFSSKKRCKIHLLSQRRFVFHNRIYRKNILTAFILLTKCLKL